MATKADRSPIRNRGLTLIPVDQKKRHEEWLQIRKKYIGGSDAGAIVGMNSYSSPFSVWAEKTGITQGFEGNISTRTGTFLEPFVADLFMEETGKKVQQLKFTVVNPAYPWACANIDREILYEDALLEIKTTTSIGTTKMFRGGEYPEQWYAQMTHYLAVTGAQKAYLAVLESNRAFHIFTLERDEAEIKALMDAEKDFWTRYVETRKAPPVDGSDATSEAVKQIFSTDTGDTVDLTGMGSLFQRRAELQKNIKSLKEDVDNLDNQLKVAMGTASKGTCGGWSVSWKMQNTGGLDRDAIRKDYPGIDFNKYTKSQTRVFRVSERKTK